tara:strand:- start:33316 stop:34842 length:1527 start_codon:yes stop_codon:yes gene_type:complete
MSKSIVIVGAGPGGLSAAMLLASRGFQVRVVERQGFVGGRTSTFGDQGYKFDLGPTFFLYPQILEEIFADVGYNLRKEVEMRRLDPQYRILFGAGGHIDATPEIAEMERQIAGICPSDAGGFSRFMDENREKLKRFTPALQSAFQGWSDLLQKELVSVLPMLRPHQSVDAYLKKFFSDPRVRLAFCFQSKYLGMSPFRCPSLFSILSFLEYEHGVYHPIGGCGAISQAMARIAGELGVEIHLDEPVESLEFNGRRVTAVQTSKAKYDCDSIVVNADFARAMTSLVPDNLRRRWTNRKIGKKQFSCSTYMIYLGVEGEYDLPHHNIYISEDYEGNLKDIEKRLVLSKNPSFYVQNAGVTDPTLAPKGHSALYVLVPVPHQTKNIDWNKESRPFRDRVMQEIRKAGFDVAEERINYERVVTPDDWDSQYNIHLGATFNLAHSLNQMLHFRPRNRFEDLDGVYLVGGGTHPGSGLPVIFESARITTDLMFNDFGVSRREPSGSPALEPAAA